MNECNKQEYKKTLADEIDWKIIDQLHNVTLNFSSKSLEIKRIFVIFIGILVPVALQLSKNTLSWALFSSLYVVIISFWLVDSYTYYYQEKLRGLMNKKFESNSLRNGTSDTKHFVIDPKRVKKKGLKSLVKSMFNFSHLLYYIMIILNLITSLMYWKGIL